MSGPSISKSFCYRRAADQKFRNSCAFLFKFDIRKTTQPAVTCSKSTIETPEQCGKSV